MSQDPRAPRVWGSMGHARAPLRVNSVIHCLNLFFACVESADVATRFLTARGAFLRAHGRAATAAEWRVVPRSANVSRARILSHESCEALCPVRGATRARGHKNCMNGSVGVVTKATRVATLRLYAEGCYFPLLLSCPKRSQDSHARSRTATQTKRRRSQGHTRLGAVSRLVTG